jgi:hypothetical protein
VQNGTQDVTVAYYRDLELSVDPKYDSKTFTACFGSGTSNGEWTGLPSGDYYFKAMDVDGGGLLWANKAVEHHFADRGGDQVDEGRGARLGGVEAVRVAMGAAAWAVRPCPHRRLPRPWGTHSVGCPGS